jgi:hypothetical protein
MIHRFARLGTLVGMACALMACTPHPATAEPGATPGTVAPGSAGWTLTVYYTAVESFHHGPDSRVTGCPALNCAHGADDLGNYPEDFAVAVRSEGTGRITGGPHTGKYLNWSVDTGYWLDTQPRDTNGRPLEAFVTAAADDLRQGARFRLVDCGHQDDGSPVPPDVCRRLASAAWQIRDAFTPGLGGPRHIDLYIGEETTPDFTQQPIYLTLADARVAMG